MKAGDTLGPYRILDKLGEGGMGEVYRATDTNLKRAVAIKVLPAELAQDAERLARFQREAEVLAALNHPHIAAIYGLERAAGLTALVMELVEGPTLADRLASSGALPLDEALAIAKQITDALEAAHEQGIVHRDLKPANIKVKDDGTVKVLDFGLAKIVEPGRAAGASVSASLSPTITTPAMTMAGVILGTAAYMSPEQAKGKPADRRSDIWAFGCVLYEMLTGRRPFEGDDVSDTLAFVLTRQPDLGALPAATPAAVRTLLRRCLEKDRKRRLADVSDARLEMEDASSAAGQDVPGSDSRPKSVRRSVVIGACAFALGGALVGAALWRSQSGADSGAVTRFALPLADGLNLFETGNQVVAISPDGARIAFAANRRLYVRELSELQAQPVIGTEVVGGQVGSPVFSPDGQSIAYVWGRPPSLKKIAVKGGAAVTICAGCGTLGTMSWDASGIVFAQGGQGQGFPLGFAGERSRQGPNRIMRVAPDGGEPQVLFEVTDGVPWDVQVLPGGDAVIFGLNTSPLQIAENADVAPVEAQVVVQSIASRERKVIIPVGSAPRYATTGHLLYAKDGILFARRFDPRRLEATGEETAVVEGVARPTFAGSSTADRDRGNSNTPCLVGRWQDALLQPDGDR